MSKTNLAHKDEESNCFNGGYRVLSAHRIQLIINAHTTAENPLTRFDLRVFCALTEREFKGSKPTIEELRRVLSKHDRPGDIRKSLERIESVLAADTPKTTIKALIPRRALRYLAEKGNATEIILVLKFGLMALRKQGFEFRAQTVKLAGEFRCRQKTVSDAMVKLRNEGIISYVDPDRTGFNHSRFVQAKGLGNRYRWSCYGISDAEKPPRPPPNLRVVRAEKPPTFGTKTLLNKPTTIPTARYVRSDGEEGRVKALIQAFHERCDKLRTQPRSRLVRGR